MIPGNSRSTTNTLSSFSLRRNDRMTNDVKPLYEELKTVYDWSDDEVKINPRIKGNQRLHCEPNDKVDPAINVIVESPVGQMENPKLHSQDRISGR